MRSVEKENNNYNDPLIVAGREFHSRLMVGTGRYKDFAEAKKAIGLSGTEVVTMAIRRINLEDNKGTIMDHLPQDQYTYLPNSAACYTADEAVRTLRLGREICKDNLTKLEVIGDKNTLLPDMEETVIAAKTLVKEGFDVMVYCSADLDYAKKLEDIGCAAIMPLAAPIGTGQGIVNSDNIQKIIDAIKVPVIVDAGIGTASDAVIAMEMGADAVLLNTAIAGAKNPAKMAIAMRYATISGRQAYLAGRMEKKDTATASSPFEGVIK